LIYFLKAQFYFWIIFLISLLPLFIIYRFWFFLRNPKRQIPQGNNIVSPADGYVLYVKRIKKKEVPISVKKEKKIILSELMDDPKAGYDLVIGVFMTPFSVHYNRIPFSANIVKNHYRKCVKNKSMLITLLNIIFNIKPLTDKAEYLTENERNTLVLKNKNIQGAVVQIASTWIDNIKNKKIKAGQKVNKGDIFGMIRMGSQCDFYLKIKGKYKILVKEKDYVKAGSSALIELL